LLKQAYDEKNIKILSIKNYLYLSGDML